MLGILNELSKTARGWNATQLDMAIKANDAIANAKCRSIDEAVELGIITKAEADAMKYIEETTEVNLTQMMTDI